jgi:hypothetical protein
LGDELSASVLRVLGRNSGLESGIESPWGI